MKIHTIITLVLFLALILVVWFAKDSILQVQQTSDEFKARADSLTLELNTADSIATVYKTIAEEQAQTRAEIEKERTKLLAERTRLRKELRERLLNIESLNEKTYTIEEIEAILTEIISR